MSELLLVACLIFLAVLWIWAIRLQNFMAQMDKEIEAVTAEINRHIEAINYIRREIDKLQSEIDEGRWDTYGH